MIWFCVIITSLAIGALGFGFWGRYTESGHRAYDEMAGMIPLFSYYVGWFLAVIAIACWAYFIYRLIYPVPR